MGTGVRDKYNIALNGKGYILRGSPDKPSYSRTDLANYIERLAISDLQYSDFANAGLFYIAQTDWSQGIKSSTNWQDDGKFYYSTNIDAFSKPGSLQLSKEVSSYNNFTPNIRVGGSFEANSATTEYVGTEDTGGNGKVYRWNGTDTWVDIAGTTFGATPVVSLIGHKNALFAGTDGASSNLFKSWNGTSWTDHTSALATAFTGTPTAVEYLEEVGGTLYVAAKSSTSVSILTTADAGSNFSEVVTITTSANFVGMRYFAGKIFYLLYRGNTMFMRVYDPVATTDVPVPGAVFYGTLPSVYGRFGNRYLQVFGGKLIITVPALTTAEGGRIYEFDGDTLTQIHKSDAKKLSIGNVAFGQVVSGCVEINNLLVWSNLAYDGTSFFNYKKPNGDTVSHLLFPLYVSASGAARYINSNDYSDLLRELTTYKTTAASNYLVMSEMSQVSKIDKLLWSITVLFNALASGESIRIDYSINGGSSWTTAATLTPSTEGANIKREIFFSTTSPITFNKIMLRVHLGGGGSTTPTVNDVVVTYKPIPHYKNRWRIRVDASDGVKLLNGQNVDRSSMEMLSEFWNAKQLKRTVLFEDIDYAECTLTATLASGGTSAAVNSTARLPRQGRMRLVSGGVSEEIRYTSTTPHKILGISRGQRGTRARAYTSGQMLKNDYDVYIENVAVDLGFTDEQKSEGFASLSLIEV